MPNKKTSRDGRPPNNTSGDAILAMVRQGVSKAREKLVDLTLRNGMLNFRHSESSGRHVRFIDEKLDFLTDFLEGGRAFEIAALPPSDVVPPDEDTDDFRSALKDARATDSEWLAAEDARRAAGNRRRGRDRAAERALRDRLRLRLGMPPWLVSIDPKARAKELGIDPSYDLPQPTAEERAHHTDNKLQTLFFPEKLAPKLASIHSAARTLQEDAGINALFCALGFIEWYEAEDSQNPCYAPLVLFPVDMEKRVSNGEYLFSIKGRDEDTSTNVALIEKFRRHHELELPEYDPEEPIESYLAMASQTIANKRRWRVRRWATLGLFSFSRQAMWEDLDPNRWPAESRPELHELLQQIYGDAPAGSMEALAPTYDVDNPDIETRAPVIITDADASQFSAVVDASEGASLVIQGPPGTGKSQTITNIIANAVYQGKSVLFISEKMAALNVVKNRLDKMGLGLYCLEVHSAKASKTLVLQSLRERMQAPRPRINLDDAKSGRDSLWQTRQRLTDYAKLMNGPAGTTGLTVYDVLWGYFCRSDTLPGVPESATATPISIPLSIDRYRLAELKSVGKGLDDVAAAMGDAAEPANQAWRGVGNSNLTRFDRQHAVQLLVKWHSALVDVRSQLNLLRTNCAWPEVETLSDALTLTAKVSALPLPNEVIIESLLAATRDPLAKSSLTAWANSAIAAAACESSAEQVCSILLLSQAVGTIDDLVAQSEEMDIAECPKAELPNVIAVAQREAESATELARLLLDTYSAVVAKVDALSFKAELVVAKFLQLVAVLPPENRKYRSSPLSEDGAAEELSNAQVLAREARAAFNEAHLPNDVRPNTIPPPAQLRRAAGVLLNTGLFGRLRKEWREASKLRKSIPFDEQKMSRDVAARRLRATAQWAEKIEELETCSVAKHAAGRHWKGVATPFEELVAVAEWMRNARKATGPREEFSKFRDFLFNGADEELDSLGEWVVEAKDKDLLSLVTDRAQKALSVTAEAVDRQRLVGRAKEILSAVTGLSLNPRKPIRELAIAKSDLIRAGQHRTRMSAETLAVRALATRPSGLTDPELAAQVLATIKHGEELKNADLPPSIIEWLLTTECMSRTQKLQSSASELVSFCQLEELARVEVDALLQLKWIDWSGKDPLLSSLATLTGKAERATLQPEQLEKQVQLLNVEKEAATLGLGALIDAWVASELKYQNVAQTIEATFYRSAAEKLIRDNPVLANHSGKVHEQARNRFAQLDKEMLAVNCKVLAAALHQRSIPPGQRAQSVRDYTDYEMLSHQAGLQKPRIALRRLFSRAGGAIRALKPCIMMSPMSVAQYLEAGAHSFDLLVIDEASQMRPEDALGAFLRSSQAVIVGDPEQLPPTDFFMAANDESEEDAEDAPEESILELGRRCWRPMRMLEVHYRSRHQSLIAYSNKEFYQDSLLVFPSPIITQQEVGVSCRRVDGAYEPGQGRNPIEARAIADEAAALMRKHIDRSIGIVAVNQAQSDLIERIVDEIAATDVDVQAYKQAWAGSLENFFVKNLENVQGDERDIILISTVYGKTAEGVFHQNFGPINKAYGHRRLNVLFTRAKQRLVLFTSLNHADILTEGRKRGVRVLKEFLEYAESGKFQSGRATGEEADSDFERWFIARLKSAGYEAHPQVGVAKFRIDIGIVHPDKPGNYILGVECDGATYHSSRSARDRDRLRQDILERLHWRIHRVWSTDWYRDPEREFERLVQTIERLRLVS